jgi:hypothetical protein
MFGSNPERYRNFMDIDPQGNDGATLSRSAGTAGFPRISGTFPPLSRSPTDRAGRFRDGQGGSIDLDPALGQEISGRSAKLLA